MIARLSIESLDRVAEVIAQAGIIAFRTDTFYGLGVDPFNSDAIKKIKRLKGGEENKPILIVVSDENQTARFINEPTGAFNDLAKAFWPGPLTLVGKANANVPEEITAGTQTVGVRLPNDERARALVRACGGALTATSANPSNAAPARDAQTVLDYFGEAIDLIIDDDEGRTDRPSTVVDVSAAEPRLIREGILSWIEIQATLTRVSAVF